MSSRLLFILVVFAVVVAEQLRANGQVVINEVMALNEESINNDGDYPDWIELYNPTDQLQRIDGMSLSDDEAIPGKFVFPGNTFVPARGFLIVWCDSRTNEFGYHTGFTLSASGQTIALFATPAQGSVLRDSVKLGIQIADLSVGRSPDGGPEWTLNEPTPWFRNLTRQLASPMNIKINEWMASPSSGSDWFELYNPAADPARIGSLLLSDDPQDPLNTRIPPLSFIGAFGYVKFIADQDATKGADHVDFKLGGSGDDIALFAGDLTTIDRVTFLQQIQGVSQGRLPDGGAKVVSFGSSATPGDSNYQPIVNVVISEILSHSDPPLEDAVEIQNVSSTSVPIGGWYLSDDPADLMKFKIPAGTALPARGFKVFYEYQFNFDTNSPKAFSFSSARGDEVYLSAADANGNLTGVRASARFGPSQNGVSFGRLVTSTGVDYVPLQRRTFGEDQPFTVEQFRRGTGASNAPPAFGPLVISEVHYRPPDINVVTNTIDNVDDEFIEIYNPADDRKPLFDEFYPTNSWRIRGSVEFEFPRGKYLGAGTVALVVNFDPVKEPARASAFRSKFNVAGWVQLFGPFRGNLSNGDDTVQLRRPDPPQPAGRPDAGDVPYIVADWVEYADNTPWPTAADGRGSSLQRRLALSHGNDVNNWVALLPSPGRESGIDTDGDGMSDSWEHAHGFALLSADDAELDADGDGVTNVKEFRAGSNPLNPQSSFRILTVDSDATGVRLRFYAEAGRSYTIEARPSFATGSWEKLANVAAAADSRFVDIPDLTAAAGPKFYRIRTPAVP